MLAAGIVGAGLFPGTAQAHTGSSNPVASSYVAKLRSAPPGLHPRILGGDLKLWLQVPPRETVVVLDYRGAPYLRFSPSGVDVNSNSSMFYLNQPVPVTPPVGLSPRTRPKWERVTSGHQFAWHDGRLHALASVALRPGQKLVGSWRIPMVLNGRPTAVSGVLVYAPDPSIVWFWPIVVLLLCLWAGARLGLRRLDRFVARVLALLALAGGGLLGVGHQLYGEPFVSIGQEIVLSLILAFVSGMFVWIALRGAGPFSLLLTAMGALWVGLDCLPSLLHGFVLMVIPAFAARAATVVCLACGIGIAVLLLGFRLLDTPEEYGEVAEGDRDFEGNLDFEDADAWESLA